MRALLPLLLLAGPAGAEPLVTGGHLTLPYPGAPSAAAYVSLANPGGPDDALTGASSPLAAEAMLHESVEAEGMMRMEPVGALPLPADGAIVMAPGGLHLMLMGLEPMDEGDLLSLTLSFESGATLALELPLSLPGG
ncbi:copper chaperone PCu(A)C [Pseudoroseicyclus sp. CXY001]|uniref:copper chaperone PCu(A)C n=1 Tax=Pseudoroseicyclus sp. CXY001 TaxID=3242492 RepID=UPI003571069C